MHHQLSGRAAPQRPWLVLLHGLLGDGDDWRPLLPWLGDWPIVRADLPGHVGSRALTATGFADVSQQLSALLAHLSIDDYWLLGYSLGGRIAMYHACCGDSAGLRGLLVEGGHPGLMDEAQRQARARHDDGWAQRLRTEPLPRLLDDWYRQPVFAELTPAQRDALIQRRAGNHGPAVAEMLVATSLARQPWLAEQLHRLRVPFGYLCGANDHKFQALAAEYQLPLLSVARAGHNAHLANPSAYAARIRSFIC